MKAFKILALFVIILFFFNGCAKISSLKQVSVSEEQKAVEKQIMTILTLMDDALSQGDWAKMSSIVDEYFAEDFVFRVENPYRKNEEIQTMSLQQYRSILEYAPATIFDYKHEYKNRKIDVVPDCKSARVEARHFKTYAMDMITVIRSANYLLEGKDITNIDCRVTIMTEEQISMIFEYREGKPFITQTGLKVIKPEMIVIHK